MSIDININNQNKHWVLVILHKIKSFVFKCFKGFGIIIKRVWKILVGLASLAIIITATVCGYEYYTNSFLPQKRLNEAVEDIEAKFYSDNDSIRLSCAINILRSDTEWGYKNVSNQDISRYLMPKIDEAFDMIEKEAYSGNPKYMYQLGQLYYHVNDFIENDVNKAVYWWNEAANAGYTQAYNNIGIAYKEGIGVNRDLRKAIEWLKKGAEAREDFAQCNYGNLYEEGVQIKIGSHKETRKTSGYNYNGVKIRQYYDYKIMDFITEYQADVDDYETLIPKDIEQAKYWWKKAAAQGNKNAKEYLQKIYD